MMLLKKIGSANIIFGVAKHPQAIPSQIAPMHCRPPDNDSVLTFIYYEVFNSEQERLVQVIGPFDSSGFITLILNNQVNWRVVARFSSEVITTKKEIEQDGQHRQEVALSREVKKVGAKRLVII